MSKSEIKIVTDNQRLTELMAGAPSPTSPAVFTMPGMLYTVRCSIEKATDGTYTKIEGIRFGEGTKESQRTGKKPNFLQILLKGSDGSEVWWTPTSVRNGRPTFGVSVPRGDFAAKVRELLESDAVMNGDAANHKSGNDCLVEGILALTNGKKIRALNDTAYAVTVGDNGTRTPNKDQRLFWTTGFEFEKAEYTEVALADHTTL